LVSFKRFFATSSAISQTLIDDISTPFSSRAASTAYHGHFQSQVEMHLSVKALEQKT
jgi:hypothetical protein